MAARSMGGNLTQFPVLFSSDGKVFFCCVGAGIKMFSVRNGEHLCTLQGHTLLVTGVITHPLNSLQIISASLDGTLRIWDFYDNVSLATIGICGSTCNLNSNTRK